MNEIFLLGEVITDIDFKFIINSKRKSIVEFIVKVENEEINVIAYDNIADFCYSKLRKGNIVLINGRLENKVVIKEINILGTIENFLSIGFFSD